MGGKTWKNPIFHHGNIWKSSHNLLGFYEGAFQKHLQFLLSKRGQKWIHRRYRRYSIHGILVALFVHFYVRKTVCVLEKVANRNSSTTKICFPNFLVVTKQWLKQLFSCSLAPMLCGRVGNDQPPGGLAL